MTGHDHKTLLARYQRQMLLPGFGFSAQQALQQARVLMVGCGGLGSPVIQYLAGAGVGHFTLCDPDVVEISNLHRQTIYRQHDVGRSKAERAAEFIHEMNPAIHVDARQEWMTVHNALTLAASHDVVVDGTDGLISKYLLNDACVLARRPLVHAAVTMLAGRMLTVLPGSACLRCLFPDMAAPDSLPSCQQTGVLGPVCGMLGSMAAVEVIKIITGVWRASANNYVLLQLEALPALNVRRIERDAACLVCGDEPLRVLDESLYIA